MKKMQVLAMMALLSVGLMNLGAAAVTELLSEYQNFFSEPKTLLFGYGEDKTASVTLTLSDTSFNSFSSAVHDAIHKAENIMNSFEGKQIQFLTSGTPENQVILYPLNLIEFLFTASYNSASNNPGWKAGDPVFYVRVVSLSSAEQVGQTASESASEAVGFLPEQAGISGPGPSITSSSTLSTLSTSAAATAEQVEQTASETVGVAVNDLQETEANGLSTGLQQLGLPADSSTSAANIEVAEVLAEQGTEEADQANS